MQRKSIKSITILLCECDILSSQNEIISMIFDELLLFMDNVKEWKRSGSLTENQLILVNMKLFNSLRSYLSGIYRCG